MYGLLGATINAYFFSDEGIVTKLFPFFSALLMLTSTHVVRQLIKARGWLKKRLPSVILRVIPIYVLFSLVINAFNTWLMISVVEVFSYEELSIPVYFLYSLQSTVYFMLWTGIYLVIHYFRNYRKEEVEKWKLQSAVKDAELIALKAQINPHFLFNALNNIRALILEDQTKARDMVSHLSDLLRYSIQFNDKEKVTVTQELEVVNNYLELESIHYEERLSYRIIAEENVWQCHIPPMIIQLMVENAIKHGISKVKDGGEVVVTVAQQADDLKIEVSNTGELNRSGQEGIGIHNATERIKILFDKDPQFELFQEGKNVKSILILSLKK